MATSTVGSLGTSIVANPTATIAPTVSVLTLTVKPLTTTFTPPASCGEMHLTLLSSPGYQIWLNEPQPVPGSKFGDCYPSDFIAGYKSVYNASSSIAPMFSPLVCPEGWEAVRTWTNGYIACCASGFLLHPPKTLVDTDRPAYGGTCYSNFQVGQTAQVTQYDTSSVTATGPWIASATNDQAYAHPIDGFQLASDNSTSSSKLSGGAIAGIVIGSVAGLIALLLSIIFLVQRYRRKKTAQATFPSQNGNQPVYWDKELPTSPSTGYLQSPYGSMGGTFGNRSPSYTTTQRATQRYELGCQEAHELDGGWKGRELEEQHISKLEQG